MTEKQQILLDVLRRAMRDYETDQFVYYSDFMWTWPSYAVYVNGEMINHKYNLPPLGDAEFDALEELGYLVKIHETEKDPVTFESEKTYRWKNREA